MTWVILCGIDRSGKSSVADLYRSQNYDVIHMSSPDKKYSAPGYSGPSYLDDTMDLLMKYDGKDVIWDRSWYGELIWPHVYGRKPLLSEEDIEVLQEFEDRNQVSRILLTDHDTAAHWKRCVDNNEPLNQSQFRIAGSLYQKLVQKYDFVQKQLGDFHDIHRQTEAADNKSISDSSVTLRKNENTNKIGESKIISTSTITKNSDNISQKAAGLEKLEKANAISAVLSKRLIKQRGGAYEELESEVAEFLTRRLEELLGTNKPKVPSLSDEEVQVLKMLYQRFTEKDKTAVQPTKQPLRR